MYFITDYRFNRFYRKNLPTKWLDVLTLLNAMEKPIAKVSIVRAIWGFDKPNQIIMRGYQSKLFRSMHAAGLIHYTRGKGWEIAVDGVKLLRALVDEWELKPDVPFVKPIVYNANSIYNYVDKPVKYEVYFSEATCDCEKEEPKPHIDKAAFDYETILDGTAFPKNAYTPEPIAYGTKFSLALNMLIEKYLVNTNQDIPTLFEYVANQIRKN